MDINNKLDRIETKIDTVMVLTVGMGKDVSMNTKDLTEHIRRTNLLEVKLQRIYTLGFILAGVGIAVGYPQIITLLKVFI